MTDKPDVKMSLYEWAEYEFDLQTHEFFSIKNGILTSISGFVSSVPLLARAAGLVSQGAAESETVDVIWSLFSGVTDTILETIAGGGLIQAGIKKAASGAAEFGISKFFKSAATNLLAEGVEAEEVAALETAAAPALPEIAAAVATFITVLAVEFFGTIAIKAVADYADQSTQDPKSHNLGDQKPAPSEGVIAWLGTSDQPSDIEPKDEEGSSIPDSDDPNAKRRSGITLTTIGRNTGAQNASPDLGAVEQVILTKFADVLDVGKTNLKDYQGYQFTGLYNVTVDMANPYGGNIRVSDYDTVDYSGDVRSGTVLTPIPGYAPHLTLGVYWHDGATQAGFFNFIDGAADYAGAFSVPALYAALKTEDALFPDDMLHVKGTENITLTNQDDRFYFSGTDYTSQSGYGTINAGAGDDKILYYGGKFVPVGTVVDNATQWTAFDAAYQAWVKAGSQGAAPSKPRVDPNAGTAQEDLSLTLDGGTGNDWVIAQGGTKVTTAGGLGRDWIYNTSVGGKIWGDVANTVLDTGSSSAHYDQRYYIQTITDPSQLPDPANVQSLLLYTTQDLNGKTISSTYKNYILDNAANADNIWWSPNTTLEDAQKHDVLKFFGLPLVGGNDDGGVALELIGAADCNGGVCVVHDNAGQWGEAA